MSRYRYDPVKDRMLVLDDKTGEWKPDRKRKGKVGAPTVVPDIREFVSHATDKPVLIGSRSRLRAYERSNNVRQCGDLKPGEIIAKRKSYVEAGLAEARRLGGGVSIQWT